MLYLGGIYGGPEITGSVIDSAIGRIGALLGDTHVDASGSLDVVLHVPGSLASPGYEGVRTAALSKKEQLLQIQIAVPKGLSDNDQSQVERFLLESLRHAIRIAAPRFARAKIPYRLNEYESLLNRVERAMAPN